MGVVVGQVLSAACCRLPLRHLLRFLPPTPEEVLGPPGLPALPALLCSEDSAARRAKAAAARLRDYGEEEEEAASKPAARPAAAAAAPAGLLPSAAAAFTTVEGPPAFLDPEVRSLP